MRKPTREHIIETIRYGVKSYLGNPHCCTGKEKVEDDEEEEEGDAVQYKSCSRREIFNEGAEDMDGKRPEALCDIQAELDGGGRSEEGEVEEGRKRPDSRSTSGGKASRHRPPAPSSFSR